MGARTMTWLDRSNTPAAKKQPPMMNSTNSVSGFDLVMAWLNNFFQKFCREIDGFNQLPLLLPCGLCIAFSPVLWASGFPSLICFFSCGFVIVAS
jgi:hypothetical protein